MRFSRTNLIVYFLAILLVFIVLVTAAFFSFRDSFRREARPLPASSPEATPVRLLPEVIDQDNLQFHPTEGVPAQKITEEDKKIFNKDRLIGQLIKKLPYQGQLFKLEYDYSNNSFTVSLDNSDSAKANSELGAFLKDNQIENRNWLYNLEVRKN